MSITATLLRFLAKQDDSTVVADVRDAARVFLNSPAYAALLHEACIGQALPEGNEQYYLGMQRMVYRLNEMAQLRPEAVIAQAVALQNGDIEGLGGFDGY